MYLCIIILLNTHPHTNFGAINMPNRRNNYTHLSTMQAFIPAAGLGTRLRPLTDHRPKALVEISGTPLLKITIDNLIRHNITRIVVNIHHYSATMYDYLTNHRWDAEILISDESDLLLDTGGGLKKAEKLFTPNTPIIIHNVDVLSTINLTDMLQAHSVQDSIATLAVSQRPSSRYLLFNNSGCLSGWINTKTGDCLGVDSKDIPQYTPLAFSGIAIIEPKLLSLLPPANKPYPIIPAYLNISKYHRINMFQHNPNDWLDVGTPERLQQAKTWITKHQLS